MAESVWRQGFTKVKFRTNDLYLSLGASELQNITRDWIAGKAFGTYKGLYGHTCYVKLAEVVTIIDATAESIRLQEQDDDLDTAVQKAKELTGDG